MYGLFSSDCVCGVVVAVLVVYAVCGWNSLGTLWQSVKGSFHIVDSRSDEFDLACGYRLISAQKYQRVYRRACGRSYTVHFCVTVDSASINRFSTQRCFRLRVAGFERRRECIASAAQVSRRVVRLESS